MMRIDGDKIVGEIVASLGCLPVPPGALAVVSCDASPASHAFIGRKRAVADLLRIPFVVHDIPAHASQADIEYVVTGLSADSGTRAIVLQLPLPRATLRDRVIACITPIKDIDNLTGHAPVESPSILVVREVLSRAGRDIADFKSVVVVGRGFLVGLPIIRWLALIGIPCAILDIDTLDPNSIIRSADLLISGVGKTGVVDPTLLADGAGFIDFGFPPDADQSALAVHADRLAFFTPTPHGTGPILVAKLFENFYSLN